MDQKLQSIYPWKNSIFKTRIEGPLGPFYTKSMRKHLLYTLILLSALSCNDQPEKEKENENRK